MRLQLYEHILTLLKDFESARDSDSISTLLMERFGTSSFEDLLHVTYEQYMRKRLFYGDQQHVEWLFAHEYYDDVRDFFLKKLHQWHDEDPRNGVNMRVAL